MSFFKQKKPAERSALASRDSSPLVVPGLDSYAAGSGWTAAAQPFENVVDDFVNAASLALVHESHEPLGPHMSVSNITTYHSGYRGDVDGKSLAVANAYTTARTGSSVSVAQRWCPISEQIDVMPHGMIPRPWGLRTGDDPFDRRFKVSARNDKFAQQLLTADVRALLMQRDDWVFTMGFDSVACVCAEPFVSVDDVLARLEFLHMLVGALPAEMVHEQTRGLPTLPDGTVVDVTKPEHMRDALLSMTPEQQSTFLDQFKHITPERKAEIMAQVQLHKAGGDRT